MHNVKIFFLLIFTLLRLVFTVTMGEGISPNFMLNVFSVKLKSGPIRYSRNVDNKSNYVALTIQKKRR
jgi:hypothetical protein